MLDLAVVKAASSESEPRLARSIQFTAFAFLIASGCAGSDRGGAGVSYTRVDSAGIDIITNEAISRDNGWTLDATPITVIGRNSSDTNQQFRRFPLAVRLPDGAIVTADEGVVSVFDRNGNYVRTLVKRGSGPDELEIVSIHGLIGDTLVVRGDKLLRFSIADFARLPDVIVPCGGSSMWNGGAHCSQVFYPDGWSLTIAADSTIPISATNRPDRDIGNGFTSPGPGHLRQLYRIFTIPAARDTAYPTGLWTQVEQFGIKLAGGGNVFVVHPMYSRSYYASNGSPRRFAIAVNPDYNVGVWNEKGHLFRFIRRTNARRTPTGAEGDAARAMIERGLRGRITLERALAEITIPAEWPAFSGLVMGPGGEVIAQTAGWRESDSLSVFDVFDQEGVWVAEWTLPRRARLLEVGDDYLLAVRLAEDDVPLVEVYGYRRR